MSLQPASRNHASARGRRVLDGRTEVIRLCDAYAPLLTARQQALLRMYYQEDLSLGEIAGRLDISRQAVFDSLRRSVAEMRRFETRLGLLAAQDRAARARAAALGRLRAVERALMRLGGADGGRLRPLSRALGALREAL